MKKLTPSKRVAGRGGIEKSEKRPWQDNLARLSLYFVVASFAGHWLEMAVQLWLRIIGNEGTSFGIGYQPLEPYPVYGIAVVVMVVLWQSLPKKVTKNLPLAFLVLTAVCVVAEYFVGRVAIWWFGQNPFWCYLDKPFNLHGLVSLQNALLFGIAATMFMFLVFPLAEKGLNKLSRCVLFVSAGLALIIFTVCHVLFGTPLW
ncbi:putative ABC transporter permease [Candidatus Saccharibacteria bacterium]|nr:putative ABC transporter permease [Candidatus Saccharibacteria bacterium]